MHFGRIKLGDHYSVSPEATLGPTQGARGRLQDKEREQRAYKRVKEEE
jgi:hypothetical protein